VDIQAVLIYGIGYITATTAMCAVVYQMCAFESCWGRTKSLLAQKSNSNTVGFNIQTYIYINI
jgi:hypothetical protein